MKIRLATSADELALRGLWEQLVAEPAGSPGGAAASWEETWRALGEQIAAGLLLLAEGEEGDEGADGMLGFVDARLRGRGRLHLEAIYVRPSARREGVAKALLAEIAAAARRLGAAEVTLEVDEAGQPAGEIWAQLGFEPVAHLLGQSLESLESRLAAVPEGPSRASTHVQSDDRPSVERALAQFVPRLGQVEVRDAADGWIRIADPLLDADREAQSRLAGELSERLGAVVCALALEHGAVVRFRLYERGRMVDEYLSVPTFYGPISKGDELALEANYTLVARLTGAEREEVRRIARNAGAPADLPAASELYDQIARMMGLEP